jgi:hypothetical protein
VPIRRHPGTGLARGLLSRSIFETLDNMKKWHICHPDESP